MEARAAFLASHTCTFGIFMNFRYRPPIIISFGRQSATHEKAKVHC